MPVPEAPADKYDRLISGEDNVRRSRQSPAVQPESEPRPMKHLPHQNLRFGVFRLDTPHHAGASCGVDDVSHVVCVYATSRSGWTDCSLIAMMPGFIRRATSLMTGITTELPNCL